MARTPHPSLGSHVANCQPMHLVSVTTSRTLPDFSACQATNSGNDTKSFRSISTAASPTTWFKGSVVQLRSPISRFLGGDGSQGAKGMEPLQKSPRVAWPGQTKSSPIEESNGFTCSKVQLGWHFCQVTRKGATPTACPGPSDSMAVCHVIQKASMKIGLQLPPLDYIPSQCCGCIPVTYTHTHIYIYIYNSLVHICVWKALHFVFKRNTARGELPINGNQQDDVDSIQQDIKMLYREGPPRQQFWKPMYHLPAK